MTNAIEALMQAALNAPARRRQDALRVLQGEAQVAEEPDVAPANEPYLSLGDLAKRLGVSRITLWHWRVPVRRASGEITLLPEGYDAESLTFTATSKIKLPEMNLGEARTSLENLLKEFGFADSGRSKVNGSVPASCRTTPAASKSMTLTAAGGCVRPNSTSSLNPGSERRPEKRHR